VDLRASGGGDPQRIRSELPPGARKKPALVRASGLSLQKKPARRATQWDEEAIERWKEERWPELKKRR